MAIALDAMARHPNQRVLFAVVPDLLDHLRATFDPGNAVAYDDRFEQIRNANLLVLDDLGTENTTPWAREKLYQIFNHRYNQRLPTVVTSNQDFKRIEDRVLSRILDTRLTRYVHVDAEDYRRRRLAGQGAHGGFGSGVGARGGR
ncbi:MAG: Helicase loader DnaI [uncultured Thermomicrobiales bacterium]|uniref:Helicase loader DnaI n=1 Tax=uncultured Thermomicrobiales bacterium TaxID=1645740 RepID=A0A6J4UVW6_9BACT|nr:MAG: Helicase loader DnaI [uncultured Thermomicrobiales bacterium]